MATPRAWPLKRAGLAITGIVLVGSAIAWAAASRSRHSRTPAAVVVIAPFAESDTVTLISGAALAAQVESTAHRHFAVRPWRNQPDRPLTSDRTVIGAARRLGGDYVLMGTVSQAGERITVVARLVSVDGGTVAWSGTFWRHRPELASLPEAVVLAVADVLGSPADDRRRPD